MGSTGPIGLDFEVGRLHLAQLEIRRDSYHLRAARSLRHDVDLETLLDSRSELRRLVVDTLRRGEFKGRRIVTAAPSADLRLMVLNYRLEAGRSDAEQIIGLARERMRDDLSEHVVDYVPIRTSGDQQGERSALVAITPEEPVIRHLERLRRAGLVVEALEIAPVSIRRLVAALGQTSAQDIVLIIRIRPEATELTLLSGRRLLLYREVDIGYSAILAEVSKALDCDDETARDLLASYGVGDLAPVEEEIFGFGSEDPDSAGAGDIVATLRSTVRPSLRGIVEQAHKAVSYAAFQTRGMSLEKVYLLEGATPCPGLDGLLAEMLQLPVEPFPLAGALVGVQSNQAALRDQRYAVALGMSLRGIADV
jgi:Tfp pilus assembly PilM family ATPase